MIHGVKSKELTRTLESKETASDLHILICLVPKGLRIFHMLCLCYVIMRIHMYKYMTDDASITVIARTHQTQTVKKVHTFASSFLLVLNESIGAVSLPHFRYNLRLWTD